MTQIQKALLFISYRTFPIFHQWEKDGLFYLDLKGTAFFIDDKGHFLTAYHVVSNLTPTSKLIYGGCMPANHVPFRAIELINNDIERDVCLGRVPDVKSLPIVIPNTVELNKRYLCYGYPSSLTGELFVNNKFNFNAVQAGVINPLITKRTVLNCGIEKIVGYTFDNPGNIKLSGFSGCPCFNMNGCVFGMLLSTLTNEDSSKTGFCSDIDYLLDILNQIR